MRASVKGDDCLLPTLYLRQDGLDEVESLAATTVRWTPGLPGSDPSPCPEVPMGTPHLPPAAPEPLSPLSPSRCSGQAHTLATSGRPKD
jgi:hypothetical protein